MSSTPQPQVAQSIQVAVTNLQALLAIDSDHIRTIVRSTMSFEQVTRAEVSILIVDDAAIRVINAQHLAHDWPTDVVSFPMGTTEDGDFGGELVISAETAAREAHLRQLSPHDELALYVVHGLLHLCGYDDLTEADSLQMRRREGELLSLLGIENPFRRERVNLGSVE